MDFRKQWSGSALCKASRKNSNPKPKLHGGWTLIQSRLAEVGAALNAAQHHTKPVAEVAESMPALWAAAPWLSWHHGPHLHEAHQHLPKDRDWQHQGGGTWVIIPPLPRGTPGPPGPTVHPSLCPSLCPSSLRRKMGLAFCLAGVRQSRFVR